MRTMLELEENVTKSDTAKLHNVSPEAAQAIIEEYQREFLACMLTNGYALMTENLRVEIVPIQPRKYVLKGKEYLSTRVYKLKASMGDPIYDKIRDKFDPFRDDLEGGDY